MLINAQIVRGFRNGEIRFTFRDVTCEAGIEDLNCVSENGRHTINFRFSEILPISGGRPVNQEVPMMCTISFSDEDVEWSGEEMTINLKKAPTSYGNILTLCKCPEFVAA